MFGSVGRGLAVAVLSLLTSFVAGASPAAAHAGLVSTSPSDGATLASFDRVELNFQSPVEPGLSEVKVFGPDGKRVDRAKPVKGSGGKTSVAVNLAPSTPGLHKVVWKIGSSDGHPMSGEFAFTVSEAVASSSEEPPSGELIAAGTALKAAAPDISSPVAKPLSMPASVAPRESSPLPRLALLAAACLLICIGIGVTRRRAYAYG